jgi:hypothetical protein
VRAVAAALLLALGPAAPAAQDADPLLDFVAGEYVLVGRQPDGGAAYAGTARIERRGDHLVLTRQVGELRTEARGAVEPAAGGDARVLRFRDAGARVMTCLVHSDLDNYARLSCLWAEGAPAQPGLESYFPTAARR